MEKYHVGSLIQGFLFGFAKRVVSDVFHGRYIIRPYITPRLDINSEYMNVNGKYQILA